MASPRPEDEDEDEDLKKAIALSLAESGVPTVKDELEIKANLTERESMIKPAGFLGLSRKAMEEERLARIASRKRERSISPPMGLSSRKAPKLEEQTVTLPSGARLNMFSTLVQDDQKGRKSELANGANARLKAEPLDRKITTNSEDRSEVKLENPSNSVLKYPNGVVKKTWAFGHSRTGNDIKLEEVLEPTTLQTAVLSGFQWDIEWVLSKLRIPPNGGSTKCIFVMQAKDEDLRSQMLRETSDMRSFLRLCFPPMPGQVHCMHSKLMLLFHADKLRIAIPTANLLNFDWGETGVMENSVFLIDLPRLPESSSQKIKDLTFFGQEVMYFIEKQGLAQDVRTGVLKFDFSATKDMAFVHTVGGSSFKHEAQRTGLPGLARALRQLELTSDNLEIDFAASSIGSLNDNFLREVHSAAKGDDLFAVATATSSKARAEFFQSSKAKKSTHPDTSIREKLRIYFPMHETVTSSTAGAAGTICLSRNWFEAATFPRSCFRDYQSTRAGLLSHNKILCARGRRGRTKTTGSRDVAWVYVGSSNVSESAWGKVAARSRNEVKINCRNWECGVVLKVLNQKLPTITPVKKEEEEEVTVKKEEEVVTVKQEKFPAEDSETESEEDSEGSQDGTDAVVGMEVFNGVIDLPFQYPGERYGSRQPWYFKEQH